jgi:hypothetical protein
MMMRKNNTRVCACPCKCKSSFKNESISMTFLFLFEVPDGSTAATLRRTSLFICSSRHQQKEKKTKKRAFDFGTRRTRERREKKQNERQNEWKHGRRKRQLCRKSRFGAGTRFASQRTRALFERARALFFLDFLSPAVGVIASLV